MLVFALFVSLRS